MLWGRLVKRLEHAFVWLNGWVLILMLTAMAVIVGYNISLRYLTSHSLPWADEAARYLMIWLTFSGAGLILRTGGHVAITNLQDVIPSTAQKLLRALIVLTLLGFFVFMVQVGWQYAQRMQYQVTPALRLPFSYIYAAMPVGFGLLIAHLLLIAHPFVMSGSYKRLSSDETDEGALPGGANG